MSLRPLLLAFPIVLSSLLAVPAAADFELSDGDTVVFLGDSNTAGGKYVEVVERYTLLRYPDRDVNFVNVGRGGDTAPGGAARFQADVVDNGATVVVVTYGINDICWGFCADPESINTFYNGIVSILQQALAAGITVWLNSYPVTGGDPGVESPLAGMGDVLELFAIYTGQGYIDVHRTTRDLYQAVWNWNQANPGASPVKFHSDGVHLTKLGHEAVAYAILTGLGGPADVSSVNVDASGPTLLGASGATVSNLSGDANELHFDRLDAGLPITFGLFAGLSTLRWIPYTQELNRYTLSVQSLPAGSYALEVDGRGVGTFGAAALAAGVNISAATANAWQPGGPWDAQSSALINLTSARRQMEVAIQVASAWVPGNPNVPSLQSQRAAINADVETLQRTLAEPVSYHFVLRRQ